MSNINYELGQLQGIDIIKLNRASDTYEGRILLGSRMLKNLLVLMNDDRLVADDIAHGKIAGILQLASNVQPAKMAMIGLRWEYMRIKLPDDPTNYCKKEIELWRNKVRSGELKFAIRVSTEVKKKQVSNPQITENESD